MPLTNSSIKLALRTELSLTALYLSGALTKLLQAHFSGIFRSQEVAKIEEIAINASVICGAGKGHREAKPKRHGVGGAQRACSSAEFCWVHFDQRGVERRASSQIGEALAGECVDIVLVIVQLCPVELGGDDAGGDGTVDVGDEVE